MHLLSADFPDIFARRDDVHCLDPRLKILVALIAIDAWCIKNAVFRPSFLPHVLPQCSW
jgi:hypothetical protein